MATDQLLEQKKAEKEEVKGYFETTGFDRWNRIYSESDDVNKVQRNIRIGHQKTVDEVLAWIKDSGELSDVNFCVPEGALLCIVGRVGSGKTTLLNGLINECPTVSGKVTVSGKMAYCSQLPWIQNMTVRENILCGEAYDQERYAAAVEACDMSDDMRSFADGDETEIGEVRLFTNAPI